MTLKTKILEANKAYRTGRPIMSDQEFDDLCEQYEATVTPEEYAAFRDSLHEETGKVKHPFIMGSLDKLKAEEPEVVEAWIKKWVGVSNLLSVSAKIDGISCRLHYDAKGNFVSATTRGDGTAGVDCTEKVKLIGKGVPKTLPPVSVGWDIRGELVIRDEDFAAISGEFANPRNACAGIINQKTPDAKLLKHISFVAYEVMGGVLGKQEQFKALKAFGFDTAWNTDMGSGVKNITEVLTNLAKQDFGYPTDGLVISSVHYKAENRYRPQAQVAFKINQLVAETEIVGVEWSTPSKDGRIAPVAVLKPVTIGGSTISRVTLNNLDWIKSMGIDRNCKVQLVKSGDVIPKIVKVLKRSGKPLLLPDVCPSCGKPLKVDGPHLRCTNPKCKARRAEEVLSFVIKLGIKRIKANTLEGWHVGSFKDLVGFDPIAKGKMGDHFANELQHKMWEADEITLFKALPFTDLAEATLDKIITHYGWDLIKRYDAAKGDTKALGSASAEFVKKGLPAGIGIKTMDSFLAQFDAAMEDLKTITENRRYCGAKKITPAPVVIKAAPASGATKTGETKMDTMSNGSICFTGALNSMTRIEAQRRAREAGFEVKTSVTAGLDYLVTNDTESGSSKNRKAKQYGTQIINEDEFLMMVG